MQWRIDEVLLRTKAVGRKEDFDMIGGLHRLTLQSGNPTTDLLAPFVSPPSHCGCSVWSIDRVVDRMDLLASHAHERA